MKKLLLSLLILITLGACQTKNSTSSEADPAMDSLRREVATETMRAWQAYKQYAWGHDALKPLSKSYEDWYSKPLYISPIDAYSTLAMMGFNNETRLVEQYVVDSLNFNKDIYAKVFEVNIRILGGLLSMYETTRDQKILDKARDFGDRLLPAFATPTGIPTYWVNLSTGKTQGDTVNVAEAGSYLMEFGLLSYYTTNPKYYQAAKKASLAIYTRRSPIGLPGSVINVQTGEWISTVSHLCAGVDSYYEYLYKAYLLTGDQDLMKIWIESIGSINQYLAEEHNGRLWYGRADMYSGLKVNAVVTLYDAFFPAILVLSGDTARAIRLQQSWNWLWNKHGLEPMAYNYLADSITYPVYDLNPEIVESAAYLYHFTGDTTYRNMAVNYWASIKKFCRDEVAFHSVENVTTMQPRDYMPTFFFAETMKYLYIAFSERQTPHFFNSLLFTTEAHTFPITSFDQKLMKERLGLER